MAGLAELVGGAPNDLGQWFVPAPIPSGAEKQPLDDVLGDGGDAFVTQFVDHVASLVGDRGSRPETLYWVELLLLSALAQGPSCGHDAWNSVYGIVSDIVHAADDGTNAPGWVYLRAFLLENADLAQ